MYSKFIDIASCKIPNKELLVDENADFVMLMETLMVRGTFAISHSAYKVGNENIL